MPGAIDRALVLFSGGQDSTVCLAWALQRFARVETVGFDYGQRHAIELSCRTAISAALSEHFPHWNPRLGEDHLVDLGFIHSISETALTRETEIRLDETGLPNTFVPGRNLWFLTTAAAIAYRRNIGHIVGGMCETDYSGYPDCRQSTIDAMATALNLGMEAGFEFHMPLMHIDKARTWELAASLGGDTLLEIVVEQTHSCYLGERGMRHPWGYGCGDCPACGLRQAGYQRYLAQAR